MRGLPRPRRGPRGQEICFNSNEDTLTIVDVTDKREQVQLRAPLRRQRLHASGLAHRRSPLLPGQRRGDEAACSIRPHADLRHGEPRSAGPPSRLRRPDHGDRPQSVHPRPPVYEANYRSGLRVLDASDVEAACCARSASSTSSDRRQPAFNGAWSVYPFLPGYLNKDGDGGYVVEDFRGERHRYPGR